MAAVVFLPGFLLMVSLQVLLTVGPPRYTTFSVEASNYIFVYILFVLPLILASLVYTAILLFIPNAWPLSRRRLVAILLSVILPIIVYALDLPGGLVYLAFFLPTLIAMITFGLFVRDGTIESKVKQL